MAGEELFTLNESVSVLQEIGLFNYVLPLGIFFLIIYGLMDQYKIISEDKKVNALLALLMSSFILLYAYMNNIEWFFALFYTKMSLVLVILLFALSFAVFGYKALEKNNMFPEGQGKTWSAVMIIMSVLIVNSAFSGAPEPLGSWASEVSGIVLAMGFVGAILSLFIKGGKGSEGGK
ncbi:MAG: hypothetical protein GOU98_02295 [Candidatus Altiarchaeota archaeon]|nr:hypothetical protein [Candidatus Altiarchaeota archaeon]